MRKWKIAKNKLLNSDWERPKIIRWFFRMMMCNIREVGGPFICLLISIFIPLFLAVIVCAIIEKITGKVFFFDVDYYPGSQNA